MPTIPKLTENVLPAFPSPEYSFIQCLPQKAIISTASTAVVNASTPIRMAIKLAFLIRESCRTALPNIADS